MHLRQTDARQSAKIADVFRKAQTFARAKEIQAAGYYPYFIPIAWTSANEVEVDGHRLVMAGSNNYLGYTHDPRVLEAAEQAARRYGTGCTGSRFLNGTLDIHEKLERDLAAFNRKEAVGTTSSSSTSSTTRAWSMAAAWRMARHVASVTTIWPISPPFSRRPNPSAAAWSWSMGSFRWKAMSPRFPSWSRSASSTGPDSW
jgi:hypothetical protein